MAAKPFSVGFRIEHLQSLIDRVQYGKHAGHPRLGAAEYQLSYKTSSGRSVYSFCMCPGGSVIASSSEAGGVVTNGMSQYARNLKNANAAIVAEVFPWDFDGSALGGFFFQRGWEQKAFEAGGSNYRAPVQLVEDFLRRELSTEIRSVIPSYLPGVVFCCPYRFRSAAVVRKTRGAFINPMNQFRASKPLLYTAAKFFSSPTTYDSQHAWKKAMCQATKRS